MGQGLSTTNSFFPRLTEAESRTLKSLTNSGDHQEALNQLLEFLDTHLSPKGFSVAKSVSGILSDGLAAYISVHGQDSSKNPLLESLSSSGLSQSDSNKLLGHLDALIKLLPDEERTNHPAINLLKARFSDVLKRSSDASSPNDAASTKADNETLIISGPSIESAHKLPDINDASAKVVKAFLRDGFDFSLDKLPKAAEISDSISISAKDLATELISFSVTLNSKDHDEIKNAFSALNPITQNLIEKDLITQMNKIKSLDITPLIQPHISKVLASNPSLLPALESLVSSDKARDQIEDLNGDDLKAETERRAKLAACLGKTFKELSSLLNDPNINSTSLIQAKIKSLGETLRDENITLYREDLADIKASIDAAKTQDQASKQGLLSSVLSGFSSGTVNKWVKSTVQAFLATYLGRFLNSTVGKIPGASLVITPLTEMLPTMIMLNLFGKNSDSTDANSHRSHTHRAPNRVNVHGSRNPRRPRSSFSSAEAQNA